MLEQMPEGGFAPNAVPNFPRYPSREVRSLSRTVFVRARYPLQVLGLAALYYGTAHLGYVLEFAGPVAAIVWLPVGIGISGLYLGGLRLWVGVALGDLLANDYATLPLGSALGQTCGNVLEVLLVAFLLHRLVPRGSPIGSIRALGRMVLAIAAGTAVSASIGSLSLLLGGVITTGALASVWRTWWLGDSSGALIVVPLALAWFQSIPADSWKGRRIEAGLMLAAVAGLSELALHTDRPVTYLVFPALIWSALRFRQRGATLAVAITAGFTVWETTHYVGPFVFDSITRSVLSTQLFLAVAALTTLCIAAVVSEREEFAERLRTSRARLVEAAAVERRRVERNVHDGAQQRLAAVVVRLRIASDRVRQAPEESAGLFDKAASEIAQAIDELRDLARGTDPAVLTEFGLGEAIRGLAGHSAIPVEFLELPGARVDEAAESTAYYVLAEALANTQKHAGASSVRVRAALRGAALQVEIVDDGIGGAVEIPGSGLQGLRDRVEALGGTFHVESAPGRTRIEAAIPTVIQ
jgi:signal transduction histidine kinase